MVSMKAAQVGLVVKVHDKTAIKPGGYGRIVRRSTKHGMVLVDSGEFPGQEVTGWYPVENVELYMGGIPYTPPA